MDQKTNEIIAFERSGSKLIFSDFREGASKVDTYAEIANGWISRV